MGVTEFLIICICVFFIGLLAGVLGEVSLGCGADARELSGKLDRALMACETAARQRDSAIKERDAAISEREFFRKSRDGVAETGIKSIAGWSKAVDELGKAQAIIGDIAELIERYDAETCGEGGE